MPLSSHLCAPEPRGCSHRFLFQEAVLACLWSFSSLFLWPSGSAAGLGVSPLPAPHPFLISHPRSPQLFHSCWCGRPVPTFSRHFRDILDHGMHKYYYLPGCLGPFHKLMSDSYNKSAREVLLFLFHG